MQSPLPPTGLAFQFAFIQSQGKRARQEDFCASLPEKPSTVASDGPILLALADGMGGHVSGQVASRTVCTSFIGSFRSAIGGVGARLSQALADSNDALARAIVDEPSLAGMGSTLVAAHVDEGQLRWASVGDSALMLYRGGILQRLNADHSHGAILDQQAAAGIISEEIAKSDARRRALHSALTGQPIPLKDIELDGEPLYPGDWVIVASDGLLTLSGDAIATLIHEHAAEAPETLVAAMISAVEAEQEPNQDNTTVAALRVVEGSADPSRVGENATASPGASTTVASTRILPPRAGAQAGSADATTTPAEAVTASAGEGRDRKGGSGIGSGRVVAVAVVAVALGLAAWAMLG